MQNDNCYWLINYTNDEINSNHINIQKKRKRWGIVNRCDNKKKKRRAFVDLHQHFKHHKRKGGHLLM